MTTPLPVDALFQVDSQEPVPLAHLNRVNPTMSPTEREAIASLAVGKSTVLTHDGTAVRVRRTR